MSVYVYLSMSVCAGATLQGRPKSREYVLRKIQKKMEAKKGVRGGGGKRGALGVVLVKCGIALTLLHTLTYSLLSHSADGSIP